MGVKVSNLKLGIFVDIEACDKFCRRYIIDISKSALIGGQNFEHNEDIGKKASFRLGTKQI